MRWAPRLAPRESAGAILLLALAAAATLTIWSADPFAEWAYEGGVFLLAGWITLSRDVRWGPVLVTAALLAVWGFGQLAVGATVYRYATLNGSLRVAALAATVLVASEVFRPAEAREAVDEVVCLVRVRSGRG